MDGDGGGGGREAVASDGEAGAAEEARCAGPEVGDDGEVVQHERGPGVVRLPEAHGAWQRAWHRVVSVKRRPSTRRGIGGGEAGRDGGALSELVQRIDECTVADHGACTVC